MLVVGHTSNQVTRIYFETVAMRHGVLPFVMYLNNCFTCISKICDMFLCWYNLYQKSCTFHILFKNINIRNSLQYGIKYYFDVQNPISEYCTFLLRFLITSYFIDDDFSFLVSYWIGCHTYSVKVASLPLSLG